MTAVQRIDPNTPFTDQLAVHSPDLLREMVSSFVQPLMSAEADTMCGAATANAAPSGPKEDTLPQHSPPDRKPDQR